MPDQPPAAFGGAFHPGDPAVQAALLLAVRAAVARLRGAEPADFEIPGDGSAFCELVVEHGLAGLVAPVLPKGAAPDTAATLRRYAAAGDLRASMLAQRLGEVSTLLSGASLPHLLLKGPALAALGSDRWPARQASDIDLLLADDDALGRAGVLLAEHDFEIRLQLPWEVHLLRAADGTVVDLHREVMPRHLPRPFDFAALWRRRNPFEIGGLRIDTPGREDTFVLLCLHLFKDALDLRSGFSERVRLDKIADLARFCERGDWPALEGYAAALGCRRVALLALSIADGVCDLGLPDPLRSRMADSPLRRSFPAGSRWLLAPGTPLGETEQILVQLRLRDRAGERFALLLTPNDEDRRAFPLPPTLAPLHYLLRPLRLAAKVARALARREFERGTP